MWPAVFRHLLALAAAFVTGWAIRLLDDSLDQEIDAVTKRVNLANLLGNGTTAYALAALALATILSPEVALPLFVAAYAVGMANVGEILSLGIPDWCEGLLLWTACSIRFGLHQGLAALFLMLAIQLADDYLDTKLDRLSNRLSLSLYLGPVGTALTAFTAFCLSMYLSGWLVLYALPSFLYFQLREQVVLSS